MKKIIAILLTVVCLFTFIGCKNNVSQTSDSAETTETVGLGSSATEAEAKATVTEDTKYGAATVSLSPEDFEALGFTLGDSCNIEFDGGYKIEDVPFFNGYYVKNGEPVMVAYPGFTNISITYNNMGIWDTAALKDGEGVTITLNEAGKYSAIQEALGQQYSFERDDYTTDEEFCNFRALSGGNLKESFLYRGTSPVDNSRGRASYTSALLEANGINFIVDLADSLEDLKGYLAADDFNSPYAKTLCNSGKIVLLGMSSSFQSDLYRQKVAEGMRQMMATDGPAYIHCMEGKDRTGFVCTLIEALAGASYDEMRADYMITYKNYFKVSAEETPEKYDAIAELYFDTFVSFLHGTENVDELKNADYSEDAANYLISGGMSTEEVETLRSFICK